MMGASKLLRAYHDIRTEAREVRWEIKRDRAMILDINAPEGFSIFLAGLGVRGLRSESSGTSFLHGENSNQGKSKTLKNLLYYKGISGIPVYAIPYRTVPIGKPRKRKKKVRPIAIDGKKICSRCKEKKPLCEFYPQPSGKFGVVAKCKTCFKEYYAYNH